MGFGASLPLLQHSLNDVRKWDTRKGCVCAPLFSCHQHSFGKVFPPPALFVFVYSKLCLDLSFVFQTIKMCVCESFHLCLWIFTFVFVNLYICVCESLYLCLWIFTFVFVNLYICVCESLHLCLWIFIPARAVTIFQLYRRSPLLHEWWRRENKTKQLSRHCDINTLTQFVPQSSPRLSPQRRSSADDIIIMPSWSSPSLFCTRE